MLAIEIKRYANGSGWIEIPFLNGKIHGMEKWYDKYENLVQEFPYINDKRHGVAKEYDENGELKTGGKNEQNRMD